MASTKIKKLKLKPSAREKRRYFYVRNKEEAEKAILDYIGILGFANSSVEFLTIKNRSVCSVKRESLNDVKAGLSLSGIKVEKVSGTLKGLSK